MIDSVVKLTEKVSELLKYRAERRTRKFKYLIEPTYVALKRVHQDYVSVFESAKNELASDRTLRAIADSLEIRRRAEEAERRAILQQAETMVSNMSLVECHSFFSAIVDYFHQTPFSGGSTPSHMLLHALRAAVNDEPVVLTTKPSGGRDPRDRLAEAIEDALSILRQNWEMVSIEYAKALAASVE